MQGKASGVQRRENVRTEQVHPDPPKKANNTTKGTYNKGERETGHKTGRKVQRLIFHKQLISVCINIHCIATFYETSNIY